MVPKLAILIQFLKSHQILRKCSIVWHLEKILHGGCRSATPVARSRSRHVDREFLRGLPSRSAWGARSRMLLFGLKILTVANFGLYPMEDLRLTERTNAGWGGKWVGSGSNCARAGAATVDPTPRGRPKRRVTNAVKQPFERCMYLFRAKQGLSMTKAR